jgi:hypothetical protein
MVAGGIQDDDETVHVTGKRIDLSTGLPTDETAFGGGVQLNNDFENYKPGILGVRGTYYRDGNEQYFRAPGDKN